MMINNRARNIFAIGITTLKLMLRNQLLVSDKEIHSIITGLLIEDLLRYQYDDEKWMIDLWDKYFVSF